MITNLKSIGLAGVLVLLSFASAVEAQRGRRPAPTPSRYGFTLKFDAKSLPKGVSIRTVANNTTTRYFIKNTSEKPLVINERFQTKRLVSGTKLVAGKVYHYFPSGVPMAGKRHLKGWQAPFGTIKETLIYLPRDPATIADGRKPGLSKKLPPAEHATIAAKYDGKPHRIGVKIVYHLNPAYDAHYGKKD